MNPRVFGRLNCSNAPRRTCDASLFATSPLARQHGMTPRRHSSRPFPLPDPRAPSVMVPRTRRRRDGLFVLGRRLSSVRGIFLAVATILMFGVVFVDSFGLPPLPSSRGIFPGPSRRFSIREKEATDGGKVEGTLWNPTAPKNGKATNGKVESPLRSPLPASNSGPASVRPYRATKRADDSINSRNGTEEDGNENDVASETEDGGPQMEIEIETEEEEETAANDAPPITDGSDTDVMPRQSESARLQRARRILARLEVAKADDEKVKAPPPPPPADRMSRDRFANGAKVAAPTLTYDPQRSEKLLLRRPAKWIWRNVEIALPLFGWGCGVVADLSSELAAPTAAYGERRATLLRRRRARQLLSIITNLGPAIIKAGQALSSRPDLLPREYLEELQKLQDDVPRYDDAVAFAIVEQELGKPFEELFQLIGDGPVAAASIGQVYKARLRIPQKENVVVALKIQRPECEAIVALDLYVLRWWSGVANAFVRLLGRDIDVQAIIDDFGELIYRELDYVAEAANANKFMELYGSVEDVFVPKVYEELTTAKVLTMEWVEGYRLTDTDALDVQNISREKLVDTLVQCSLRQILENGFFHADPHGGNLLATPDGRLCYLDFGMVSYAAQNQRNGFLLAVIHMINRDWPEIVLLYQRLGFIPEDTDLREIEVALEGALPDVLNADVSELNFKNVINKLGDIMYKYPFSLPPFYISIIRCLGVLEGVAIQIDPTFRIINDAYPYIASRLLTDPEEEMQEALRRLALTNDGKLRWNRLEGLLENANSSSGYDVTIALDLLVDYILSEEGEPLLQDLGRQSVDGADALGVDVVQYATSLLRAVLAQDAAAVANTLAILQELTRRGPKADQETPPETSPETEAKVPEPSPATRRLWKVAALLGGGEDPLGALQRADPGRFVPILQRLGGDGRVQVVLMEVLAKLGERALSRTLRAAFGLPPPTFREGESES